MAEIPIQRKEGRNIWPILIGLIVLAAVLWYVLSRRNNNTDTAAGRADSSAVATSGAGVTTDSAGGAMANNASGAGMTGAAAGAGAAGAAGSASGSGASGGSGAMTDANIADVIHEANAGEIAAGKIAQTKASNSDVKAFARDMVREHSALDKKGAGLAMSNDSTGGGSGASGSSSGASGNATGGGGAARDSIVTANRTMSSQLQSAGSGAAFDRAYIDGQVTAHQNTLAFLQSVQNQAQSPKLKQMVTQAIPDVEKHLARARTLQSKVGGQ